MAVQDWQALTRLTAGAAFEIERVRLTEQQIAIEGRFELPPLARLTADDQVFVAAFVQSHGSIKQMEKLFGVSYPTIKNRLNRIGALLPLLTQPADAEADAPPHDSPSELLARLERGEISAAGAIEQLQQGRKKG